MGSSSLHPVVLNVYSIGFGIYHTGVVVFEDEYLFGERGVLAIVPKSYPPHLGEFKESVPLGYTHRRPLEFHNYIEFLRKTTFRGQDYNEFTHNCNTFSDHITKYLGVAQIPSYVMRFNSIGSTMTRRGGNPDDNCSIL